MVDAYNYEKNMEKLLNYRENNKKNVFSSHNLVGDANVQTETLQHLIVTRLRKHYGNSILDSL